MNTIPLLLKSKNDIQQNFNRNAVFDSLRSLSILLVILIHSAELYSRGSIDNSSFWISNIIISFSRICVPILIMISGNFLLFKEVNYYKFYMKRIKKILIPLIFWSVLYVLLRFMMNIISGENFNLVEYKNIINGKPYYHLWYLYMLVGLYLVTPVLNIAFEKLDDLQKTRIGIFLLSFGCVLQIWDIYNSNRPFYLLWFIKYLGYYILGNTIPRFKIRTNRFLLLVCYIFISCIIVLLSYFTYHHYQSYYFQNYLSPLNIISSIALYAFFINMGAANKILVSIAKYSFGIYLIHAGVLDVIRYFSDWITNIVIIKIIINATITTGISILFVYICRRIRLLNMVI